MRLFVAIDISEEIRERIRRFMDELRGLAPDVRWVEPESLHITLKFIGEKPDGMIEAIEAALQSVRAETFQISFRGCGLFPDAEVARVFWVGIEAEASLAQLANTVEMALVPIGIPEEKRAFKPHLTLARAGSGSGARERLKGDRQNTKFARIQKWLSKAPPPEFGTMSAGEFFLYRSQLSPQGPHYSKVARFGLGSTQA